MYVCMYVGWLVGWLVVVEERGWEDWFGFGFGFGLVRGFGTWFWYVVCREVGGGRWEMYLSIYLPNRTSA